MPCAIWLLPDFIGHPMCFSALVPRLAGRGDLHLINYHDHWPYAGIEQLAQAVAASAGGKAPDWIVGYSFGGLVGCEVARCLADGGRAAPRLLLVDSRLPSPGRGGAATALEQLDSLPAYRPLRSKIELLAALGEVGRDCVEANLRSFPAYRPKAQPARVELIAGRSDDDDYKSMRRWTSHLPNSRLQEVDVAHQDMLIDPAALDMILSVLPQGEHE